MNFFKLAGVFVLLFLSACVKNNVIPSVPIASEGACFVNGIFVDDVSFYLKNYSCENIEKMIVLDLDFDFRMFDLNYSVKPFNLTVFCSPFNFSNGVGKFFKENKHGFLTVIAGTNLFSDFFRNYCPNSFKTSFRDYDDYDVSCFQNFGKGDFKNYYKQHCFNKKEVVQ